MLIDVGIQIEKLGGDVQAIPISALKRKNLDKLKEALVVQAELMEICGDPKGPVEAVVVESKVDTARGKLCTVVVQRGKLSIICYTVVFFNFQEFCKNCYIIVVTLFNYITDKLRMFSKHQKLYTVMMLRPQKLGA